MASSSSATNPHFSWRDSLCVATSSSSYLQCLPCLRRVASDDSLFQNNVDHNDPTYNNIPRARADELEGLLADPLPSDSEGERLSLHSDFGRSRRKKRSKKNKAITFFGFDLFGRRAMAAPIQLADDHADALYDANRSSRGGGYNDDNDNDDDVVAAVPVTASTSIGTFDLDADPLSPTTIAELSSSTSAAALVAAAGLSWKQKEADREERMRKRLEKKKARKQARERLERERLNLERLRQQGVLPEDGDGEQFEGFQGSGTGPFLADLLAKRTPGTVETPSTSIAASSSASRSSSQQSSGNWGGEVDEPRITSRSPNPSRTSSAQRSYPNNAPQSSLDVEVQARPKKWNKSSKSGISTWSGATTKSHSSTCSTSQSMSLASPLSTGFPDAQTLVSPSTIEQGLGFFDAEDLPPRLDRTPKSFGGGVGLFNGPAGEGSR